MPQTPHALAGKNSASVKLFGTISECCVWGSSKKMIKNPLEAGKTCLFSGEIETQPQLHEVNKVFSGKRHGSE